jgi:hypothetical protein
MELKKIQGYWNNFPELSMEERPVLSSDLEKMLVSNPFTRYFYLKKKILARIIAGGALLLLNLYQLRNAWVAAGNMIENDLYRQGSLFILLAYFFYYHIRLLLFADYSTLASLRLVHFLSRIGTVLDKYINSFRIISLLAGYYLLALFERLLLLCHCHSTFQSINQNAVYSGLIILFLSVSFYILLLNSIIPKYKRLLAAVRSYRDGITDKAQKL